MQAFIGIARYEFLMQWRRRAVIYLNGFFLLALIGFTLLTAPTNAQFGSGDVLRFEREGAGYTIVTRDAATGGEARTTMDSQTASTFAPWMAGVEFARVTHTFNIILLMSFGIQLLLIGALPMFADTLPNDYVYRTAEMMRALPVRAPVYVLGKLLGVWAGLLAGWAVCALVFALFLRLRFAAFDVLAYALTWLAYVAPAGLIAASLSVGVGAFFKRRRTALLMSLLLIPVLMLIASSTLVTLFTPLLTDQAQVSNPLLADTFPQAMLVLHGRVFGTLLPWALLPLALFALGAWWRETRDYAG